MHNNLFPDFCNFAMQPLKKRFHNIWTKIDTCGHSAMMVGAATGLAGFLIHNGLRILTKNDKFVEKITSTFDICYLFHCIRLYFMFINWQRSVLCAFALSSTVNFLSQPDESCN